MKKLNALLLLGLSTSLLTACGEGELKLEIVDVPKTTFYCGEQFTNSGITIRVTLPDGTSFITEDVTTSKVPTDVAGTKQVKVYYVNEKYDINTWITYDINVIDWTKEEKAFFSQTTISSTSGVYYPKLEGMQVFSETDDVTGEIVDYWIEKPNAKASDIDTYNEMLKNYSVTKKVSVSGTTVDMTFKFYEQAKVPSDFVENYDIYDAICYKYCASYIYMDQSTFQEYEFYGNEIEDTVVFGLNDKGSLVVRFIANSVFLESMLANEVNEHLDGSGLYSGQVVEFLKQTILGYTDEESKRHLGYIEELAPYAKDYFIMPDYEPDVCAVKNFASMYPWEHGEDDLSFELEIDSDDEDGYNALVAALDAKTDFTKKTETKKVKDNEVNVTCYTIDNKDYVGSLEIQVSDFIEKGASYYIVEGSQRTQVDCGVYTISYTFIRPEVFSPTVEELTRIYDLHYGISGKYTENDYDRYEEGTVGGVVKFAKSPDGMNSATDALNKFVNDYLTGYTCTSPAENKTVGSITVLAATYQNDSYTIDIYAYYSGGKYCVEFSIAIKK